MTEASRQSRYKTLARLGCVSGRSFAALFAVLIGGAVWVAGAFPLQGMVALIVAAGVAVVVFLGLRWILTDAFEQAGRVVGLHARPRALSSSSSNSSNGTPDGEVANPPLESLPDWAAFQALADSMREVYGRYGEQLKVVRQEIAYFRKLAEDTTDLEAFFGVSGRLLWAGPAIVSLTGYSLEENYAAVDPLDLWVYVKDRPAIREHVDRALSGEIVDNVEIRIARKDGSLFWCSCKWLPYYAKNGEMTGIRFSGQDIERRKQAEMKLLETVAALRRAQALKEHYLHRSDDERMRLSALLDIVNLGILFVGRDRRVVYANQPFCDMWGLGDRSGVVGTRDATVINMTADLRVDDDAYRAHVDEVIPLRRNSSPYEIRLRDGRVIRELSARVQSSLNDKPTGRVWIYEDVTEALRAQTRLTELAERDPLTGLFNRRRFHEELTRQMAESNRRGEKIALLSIDLDGFKSVNDTLGHQAGDDVLVTVANEVGSVVRRNELFFRLGGDEFAILVSDATVESTEHLAQRIVERAAGLLLHFAGGDVRVTLSVGIALTPAHATHPEGLMLAADRAMYQAKMRGKNQWAMAESSNDQNLN